MTTRKNQTPNATSQTLPHTTPVEPQIPCHAVMPKKEANNHTVSSFWLKKPSKPVAKRCFLFSGNALSDSRELNLLPLQADEGSMKKD